MGLFESIVLLATEIGTRVFGVGKADELKRRKKAAACRRYRSNLRRRKLEALSSDNVLGDIGLGDIIPASDILVSGGLVDGTSADPISSKVRLADNFPGDGISTNGGLADGVLVDSSLADGGSGNGVAGDGVTTDSSMIITTNVNDTTNDGEGTGVIAITSSLSTKGSNLEESSFEHSSGSNNNSDFENSRIDSDGDCLNEDQEVAVDIQDGQHDESSEEFELKDDDISSSSSSINNNIESSVAGGFGDGESTDLEEEDNDSDDDGSNSVLSVMVPPAEVDGMAQVDPARLELEPVPRRCCPHPPGLTSILGNIPHRTMSNDPIWLVVELPDLVGLVVHAEDPGQVFVVPRSFYGCQVYTAKHLSHRHTVMDLSTDLRLFLAGLDPPVGVRWYGPNIDHADDFFVILNLPNSISTKLGMSYPFEALARYTSEHEQHDPNQVGRQVAKLNVGFTGTQSMPTRDVNGHPSPSIKSGTDNPIIVLSFVSASEYIRNLDVPWNDNRPLAVPSTRTRLFASRIGNRVIFEGATHTTHQRCVWHRDVQNPAADEKNVSHVTTISKQLQNGGYIVSIYYFRLSISVNLRRNISSNPILQHFVESFNSFPVERRRFSRQSLGTGTGFCAVPPNLDTISFHSLVGVCITTLVDRFGLNLYEAASLVVCYLFMPNTAEPFGRATIRCLRDGRMGRRTNGYQVGLAVLRSMLQEQRAFNVRFNLYCGDPEVDDETFRCCTTSLFWLLLHVWSAYPTRPSNKVVAKAYTAIRNLMSSLIKGVGKLIAMHAVQLCAELGLLPPWLQTYAAFDHTGRVFRWYAGLFGFQPTATKARQLMGSLPTGMEVHVDGVVYESMVENLGCKTFQRSGGTVETRRDVHHHAAPILTRTDRGDGLKIVFVDGEEIVLEGGCVIPRWQFGDDIMSLAEIAAYLELPAALPGQRSLGNSRIPDKARARPVTTNVPFTMPRWWR